MTDSIGDRMKDFYENRTRYQLPRRTYTILRVDGRAFHTWTKGLTKPYDPEFMECMDAAAIALCKEVAGAKFAFVQSDEISLLATDFDELDSQAWFDGNIQKWASVSSGIATAAFNEKVVNYFSIVGHSPVISSKKPNAVFDARVFTIPSSIEVSNYFIWRQQDAERNSVTLLASNYASHKQLHGKNSSERHEIIHNAGDNWANHPVRFKHGGIVRKYVDESLNRTEWKVDTSTPVFTKDREYLQNLIPKMN